MRAVVDTNVVVSAALKDKFFPALALRVMAQRGRLPRVGFSHMLRKP